MGFFEENTCTNEWLEQYVNFRRLIRHKAWQDKVRFFKQIGYEFGGVKIIYQVFISLP